MSGRGSLLRIVMAAALVWPVAARGEPADPHIARARAHLEELALDLAQTELDLALRAGGSDRARLVEIHRMLGIVFAGLDHPEQAVDAFRTVLALDPRAEVAAELGPKIGEPFAHAKLAMQGRAPLAVQLAPHRRGNTALVVIVASDPVALVTQARARFTTPAGEQAVVVDVRAARTSIEIPPGALRASVAALDAHGNRIAELDVTLAAPPPPVEPGAPASTRPGVLARWTVWGGASIGLGAIGLGFALAARSTRDELDALEQLPRPAFSQVEALDARGQARTRYANIAFGAAGAAAIVAAVLFVRTPHAPARVAVTPAGDGGLVLLSGGF